MKHLISIVIVLISISSQAQVIQQRLSHYKLKNSSLLVSPSSENLEIKLIKEFTLNTQDTTLYVVFSFYNSTKNIVQRSVFIDDNSCYGLGNNSNIISWDSQYKMPLNEYEGFYDEIRSAYSYSLNLENKDVTMRCNKTPVLFKISKYKNTEYQLSFEENFIPISQEKLIGFVKALKGIEELRTNLQESPLD